jgi:hypothetical protein
MSNREENKALLKKGLVEAAVTAATIATFLASETSRVSADEKRK